MWGKAARAVLAAMALAGWLGWLGGCKEGGSGGGSSQQGSAQQDSGARTKEEIMKRVADIHWYGHDAFRIEDAGQQIYIDPWQLPDGLPKADVILVTHEHHDHYSADDIDKVVGPKTLVMAPTELAHKMGHGALGAEPGRTMDTGGVSITTVPAYNVDKKFHPKGNNWLGYIVTLKDGTTVYHAGDTDFTPEMKALKVDIALLPVSGTYVMTAEQAAEAANAFRPAVVIPMHYGTIVGTADDAERFKKAFQGETVIKQVEK